MTNCLGLFNRRVHWLLRTLAFLAICSQAAVQQNTVLENLGPDEVMRRVVAMNDLRAEALYSYSSFRSYHLECHGVVHKNADMLVRANYERPNKEDFTIVSEVGSSAIRHRVFRALLAAELDSMQLANQQQSAITSDNYRFRLVRCQKIGADEFYVVEAQPRRKNRFLFRGRVWVNAKEFVITRIEGEPVVNPSWWIHKSHFTLTYEKIGDFWLPESNQSVSKVRFVGTAVLTITYANYQIIPTPYVGLAVPTEKFSTGQRPMQGVQGD